MERGKKRSSKISVNQDHQHCNSDVHKTLRKCHKIRAERIVRLSGGREKSVKDDGDDYDEGRREKKGF